MSICLVCNKEFKQNSLFLSLITDGEICINCFSELPFLLRNIKIDEVDCFCLYWYEGKIKEMLINYKVKKDKELRKLFLVPFKSVLRWKYKGYTVVFVPSNKASDRKRGFNHVHELAKELGLPIIDCFYKRKTYKQSDLKYKDRKKIEKVLFIKKEKIDPKRKYLIIDDILTSGSTMKRCVCLLKENGVKKIKGLVVATNFYNYRK